MWGNLFHKRLFQEDGLRGEGFTRDHYKVQNMSSTDIKTATGLVAANKDVGDKLVFTNQSTTISFSCQEIQATDEHLESMGYLIQDFFRNGCRANRDLFAMRLATLVRVIRETINEGVLE